MARRDSNIDPFNAGEPVLPWDDPSQMHDDLPCTFDNDAYEAPEKAEDDYTPPSSRGPSRSERRRRLAEQRERTRQAEESCARQPVASDGVGTEGRSEPLQSAMQQAASRGADGLGFEARDDTSEAPAREAQNTRGGTRKRRGAAKVFRFAIIAIVCVSIAGSVIGAIFELINNVVFSGDDYSYSYDFDDYDYELTLDIDEEAGELAVQQLFEERYSSLAENEDVLARIAASFSSECETYLGYTAEELGLDANAYASWIVSGFSYTMGDAYCYDGYNNEDPDGTVYFESTGYDAYGTIYDFSDRAFEYLIKEGINPIVTENLPELDEGQKSTMRRYLAEAMSSAAIDDDSYNSQAFYYSDGEWKMNEDDFSVNIDGFFSMS